MGTVLKRRTGLERCSRGRFCAKLWRLRGLSTPGELLFLGRTLQRRRRALPARYDLRDVVEVSHADEFLVLGAAVSIPFRRKLARLEIGIGRHASRLIVPRQLEHAEIQRVERGQRDELEFVAQRAQVGLEVPSLPLARVPFPIKGGRAVVRAQLAGLLRLYRLG